MSAPSPFTVAHRRYVQSLYRRYLNNELNWVARRDIWRGRAIAIRAAFERNRNVHDPRELAIILEKAEADLAERQHPDPYRREYLFRRAQTKLTYDGFPSCRGPVSAISAPYQYYKDLNPSTLTGAIDVIVVNRPKQQDSNTDTTSDVQPDGETELVCSPFHVRFGKWQVLRPGDKKVNVFVNGIPVPFPMKIGEAGEAFFVFETDDDIPDDLVTSPLLAATQPGQSNADMQRAGRFGAKEDSADRQEGEGETATSQEPEFLDLNASASPEPEQPSLKPPQERFLRDKAVSARNAAQQSGLQSFEKGDEVLPETGDVQGPEVVYSDDMVFDMEGYHSHRRSRSGDTITRKDPGLSSSSQFPSPPSTPGASRESLEPGSPSPSISSSPVPFPTMRATSEPPPEWTTRMTPTLPTYTPPTTPPSREEYMWEWGSFPQRTPVRTMFETGFGAGRKGKERMRELDIDTNVESDAGMVESPVSYEGDEGEDARFGAGGRLGFDRRDPTRFKVSVERWVVGFQLSVVPGAGRAEGSYGGEGPLGGEDEVVDAQRFEHGKVEFDQFLEDERIVNDEDLVLRWSGGMYITRKDGSPLMDALLLWRDAALRGKLASSPTPSRSPSPGHSPRSSSDMSESTVVGRDSDTRSTASPYSSSWVRWWGRSRRAETAQRPDLRPMNTAPSTMVRSVCYQRSATAVEPGLKLAKRSASVASAPVQPAFPPIGTPPQDEKMSEGGKPSRKRFAKTLRLTSDQLKSLNLKPGANSITFSLSATGVVACTARLFVWDHTDQIVISDIDGTITKSDALGHVFTMIGRDWTHLGVAKLYTDICRNGYKMLYLTSRAIGQADITRDYLKGVKQNDYQLPEGPVIMSPDRLMASLHREVIMRKPEVFKMAALRDIQKLFGHTAKNPFYAGFGNRITDALSYRSVNVPSSRIFTIDSSGEVKMELLELAGYKSSYIHMTDLVDQMFPPINRKWAPEYTDFNYWKPPMQEFPLPDLSPPSPALSARSDTSTQSALARLRHFSLGGSRQANNMKQFALPPPATEGGNKDSRNQERQNESHLRQMSSFERLSSTLAGFAQSTSPISSPRSSTPTFIDSGSEDEDDDGDLEKQKRWRRRRRESMPGSLPGSDGSASDDDIEFGVDDNVGEGGYEYDGAKEEAAAEQAFDEDFLATGEMESVPFL
ncbi:hypothetical protein IEO21_05130 [Rhodonia placenta]|uniref:phosphatidate phosphatase n=1 Tax=Rhodonia placenta TaxID=104341 RepID=A0A8H7P2J5_9APHY|nr:hypothetical protein IEO21_05130 [Postia placenta]